MPAKLRALSATLWVAMMMLVGGSPLVAATLAERCEAEVVELHEWIEQWSNAELPATDEAFARFGDVIGESFLIVDPDGSTASREPIVDVLRRAHARWRAAPRDISIRNFRLLYTLGDHALAMYEEWHESRPDGQGDEEKVEVGRLSTVLFGPAPAAPNGLEWLHLHEAWVPGYEPKD